MFRVYGKGKDSNKRYKPLDIEGGRFVDNLIYASMISEEDGDRVLKHLQECNKDYLFRLKKI